MAAPDLVFRKEPLKGPPWVLVFGEPDASENLATLYGDVELPVAVLVGNGEIARPPAAQMAGDLVDLVGANIVLDGHGTYRVNVLRGPVASHRSGWQAAAPVPIGIAESYQQAAKQVQGAADSWQAGQPLPVALQGHHAATVRLAQPTMRSSYQSAWRIAKRPTTFIEHAADRSARRALGTQHQVAVPTSAWPLRDGWQVSLRDTRAVLGVSHQVALLLAIERRERTGGGLHVGASLHDSYQEAMKPPPGQRDPVIPPEPEPCYVPSTKLVFTEAWALRQALVFVCERHTTGPGKEPLVILMLRAYMATHYLEARLLPTMERVPLEGVVIEASRGMPFWKLSASGPAQLLDQLRAVDGVPRQVRVIIDGLPWIFAIEGMGRSREPGLRRARITGRSVPALLGASKLPQQTWLNAAPRTAQQLVIEAFENLGVDVDWQIPDWLVPAGAWSFTGKPLAAAVRIAEAAGAVLQSHPTEPKLSFLPAYPLLSWEWMGSAAVPDVSISSRAITVDDYDLREEPEWEAVYVYGGPNQGVGRKVTRRGTAGAVLAPMVVDDLITDGAVAIERGRSVLGTGGTQADVSVGLPILTGGNLPGVLRVNQLLQVTEPSEVWRAMVRGVVVRASPEEVRQSLTVERHWP
ncbi:hypothetical protein [Variovorax sp. PAMC26660]|uniref:hypothetical protein n=1 Tax=Variovorax sp. PAMC26660 TaxID=2762322 RepID=UPI00164D6FBA|nr:hypothetical protein [Variovorax sp. PAMC26660]QNK69185.1 hypothetical protein H7F35_05585 [Variovorax sp. PAMC26660]